jgi:biopolymer transport protein ExbB
VSPAAGSAPAGAPAPAAGDAAPSASGGAAPDASASPAAAPAAVVTGFIGDIDELQISKVARSPGVIKFAAVSQGTDPAKLIASSVDEETASWLSGYIGVILKSVTIDGWVVIGLLMIMAVISWVVMVDKARYLNKQIKANSKFQQRFGEFVGDFALLDHRDAGAASTMGGKLTDADVKLLMDSSLYRIFYVGAEEIRRRVSVNGVDQPRVLSAQSIAAIRATLDGGFVRENQGLNRLMVLLTIAISGGPFLGLLGTVVGVMITFGAIAQSGDVNVNAIAPGIAAALVATVTGLGVAIPALFGYNYLISKIKDLSSDMQVFIDEFITKMAEFYDGRASQPVPPLAAE